MKEESGMVDCNNKVWTRAASCLPDGYDILVSGFTQAGDLLFNLFSEWHGQPITSQDADLIGLGVEKFCAVARKKEGVEATEVQ